MFAVSFIIFISYSVVFVVVASAATAMLAAVAALCKHHFVAFWFQNKFQYMKQEYSVIDFG